MMARFYRMIEWALRCLRGPYRPREYWQRRAGRYSFTEQRLAQSGRTRSHFLFYQDILGLELPGRLLDFGCGTGRLFALWGKNCSWETWAVDQSTGMLERAREHGDLGRLHIFSMNGPGSWDILPDDFRVVAACEVLLHVPPDELPALLVRLNRKMLDSGILAIVTAAHRKVLAPHCFNHNYLVQLAAAGFNIERDHIEMGQRFIVARKAA